MQKPVPALVIADVVALAGIIGDFAQADGREGDRIRAQAIQAAVDFLLEAAELANRAGRLTAASTGTDRRAVTDPLGLSWFAPLALIKQRARDQLTDAILAAKGDEATLARRAANGAVVEGGAR